MILHPMFSPSSESYGTRILTSRSAKPITPSPIFRVLRVISSILSTE